MPCILPYLLTTKQYSEYIDRYSKDLAKAKWTFILSPNQPTFLRHSLSNMVKRMCPQGQRKLNTPSVHSLKSQIVENFVYAFHTLPLHEMSLRLCTPP